ncbi:hypothetical protein F5B21DRAFT_54705 [Xylaria acuta]|nr:hypothetical protein F5B21DRAFT_54705 [Xylaria acuta]
MGGSFEEWLEHHKVLRSLNAIDREMKDVENRDSGSKQNRQHGTCSRATDYRETPLSSERERFDDMSSNRSVPSSRASRSSHEATVDYNQGSRFKGEHQYDVNDRGDKATARCGGEGDNKTGAATSSGGRGGDSEEEDDGTHGSARPTSFDDGDEDDSDADSDSDSNDDGGSDDYDDYDDDGDDDDDYDNYDDDDY